MLRVKCVSVEVVRADDIDSVMVELDITVTMEVVVGDVEEVNKVGVVLVLVLVLVLALVVVLVELDVVLVELAVFKVLDELGLADVVVKVLLLTVLDIDVVKLLVNVVDRNTPLVKVYKDELELIVVFGRQLEGVVKQQGKPVEVIIVTPRTPL